MNVKVKYYLPNLREKKKYHIEISDIWLHCILANLSTVWDIVQINSEALEKQRLLLHLSFFFSLRQTVWKAFEFLSKRNNWDIKSISDVLSSLSKQNAKQNTVTSPLCFLACCMLLLEYNHWFTHHVLFFYPTVIAPNNDWALGKSKQTALLSFLTSPDIWHLTMPRL